MITFTKEQLIASAHARIEFAEMMLAGELEPLKERTWSIELELARIALASLEAGPAIHRWRRVTVEPYGPYPWHYGNFIGFSKPVEGIEDEYYYSAPPAPVSVPTFEEWCQRTEQKPVGWVRDAMKEAYDGCHAAMLQGAEPVTTAYKLPFEQWLSQQGERIEIDCGCVSLEVFMHWLRMAYGAGNSPVIQDGYVVVP